MHKCRICMAVIESKRRICVTVNSPQSLLLLHASHHRHHHHLQACTSKCRTLCDTEQRAHLNLLRALTRRQAASIIGIDGTTTSTLRYVILSSTLCRWLPTLVTRARQRSILRSSSSSSRRFSVQRAQRLCLLMPQPFPRGCAHGIHFYVPLAGRDRRRAPPSASSTTPSTWKWVPTSYSGSRCPRAWGASLPSHGTHDRRITSCLMDRLTGVSSGHMDHMTKGITAASSSGC
jgi:hypothetical protein